MEIRETQISQNNPAKSNKEQLTGFDFRTSYKCTIIKAARYRPKNGHIEQWERAKNIKIKGLFL